MGGDNRAATRHLELMDATLDIIRQSAPIEWLSSPLVIIATISLVVFVVTGAAGRVILEVETKLASRSPIG